MIDFRGDLTDVSKKQIHWKSLLVMPAPQISVFDFADTSVISPRKLLIYLVVNNILIG